MKKFFYTLLLLLTPVASAQSRTRNPAPSKIMRTPLTPEKFDINAAPTQGDWQRFHILTETERATLWQSHASRKLSLKNWAWQWRLGWLRTCGTKLREDYCNEILTEGLQDAAMVVRAEAASQFAHAYAATKSKQAIDLLAKTYARPDNFRGGKPLFVCEQILRGLQEIGGSEALSTANKLAAKDPQTKKYWNALNSASRNKSQKNL